MSEPLPPYLTDSEIAFMCRPLKQSAAQIKFLRRLGLKVDPRPDGTPLAFRAQVTIVKPGGIR